MGRYLREARHHTEKIQYFHRLAGPDGYKQAAYHYDELCGLISRASSSKNDKADAVVIAALRGPASDLIEEMRRLAEAECFKGSHNR